MVASEVRALASRSAQAAKEIETLIHESVSRVKTGAEQVQEAGGAMSVIINSIEHVNKLMTEISVASDEQSRGIDQIGQAMTEMDGVTQQNAVLVQEAKANAVSLEKEAERLNKTIAMFDSGLKENRRSAQPGRSTLRQSPQLALASSSTGESRDNWQSF